MQVTLANGLVVDAQVGCLVFRLSSQKASPEESGLPITGFSEGQLEVALPDGSPVLVSGDGIEAIACPAEPPVVIELTDGSTVTVPASAAPLVQALVTAQRSALDQIRSLLDTTQVGQLQAQLEQAQAQLALNQELLQRRTDALSAIAQAAQTAQTALA